MYEELIKSLREDHGKQYFARDKEAADAIENAWNDGYKKGVDDASQVDLVKKMSYWWIPVSEKLPPISEEVIVCTYTNMIRIWSLERYYPTVADVIWEREDGYSEDASEVTHWMPLPEPPKADEDGAE